MLGARAGAKMVTVLDYFFAAFLLLFVMSACRSFDNDISPSRQSDCLKLFGKAPSPFNSLACTEISGKGERNPIFFKLAWPRNLQICDTQNDILF